MNSNTQKEDRLPSCDIQDYVQIKVRENILENCGAKLRKDEKNII